MMLPLSLIGQNDEAIENLEREQLTLMSSVDKIKDDVRTLESDKIEIGMYVTQEDLIEIIGILQDRISNLEEQVTALSETKPTVREPSHREIIFDKIRGKTEAQISKMFNKNNNSKGGYSIVEICEIFGLPTKGTKSKLASSIYSYSKEHNTK